HGLVVDACLTGADGHAERMPALHMFEPRADRPRRITLGTDKGYDAEDFVSELRSLNVAPHAAAKIKGSAIDGRTTRHAGYKISQVIRKRIEAAFGWAKPPPGAQDRASHRVTARAARITYSFPRLSPCVNISVNSFCICSAPAGMSDSQVLMIASGERRSISASISFSNRSITAACSGPRSGSPKN